MKSKLSLGPGIKVQGITLQDDEDWLVSVEAKPVGICPDCGIRSRHRHGQRARQLADLPIQGRQVTVRVTLTRWQCRHRECRRRTFSDQHQALAPAYAHRTARMAEIVGLVGHGMGGRPTENLLHRLGIRLICPSACPLLQGSSTAFFTASRSRCNIRANRAISTSSVSIASSIQSSTKPGLLLRRMPLKRMAKLRIVANAAEPCFSASTFLT